jgi:hypothetical protein
MVNYTAATVAGGSAPVYSWIKNGTTVASTPSYSYIPSNGDRVYCIMTSNYRCSTANTASSNQLNMVIDVPSAPVVSVTAQPGSHLAAGQTAVFTANVSNAGATPAFQWYVNAAPVAGATFSVYSASNLADLDSVSCQVTSSGGCSGIVGSGSMVVRVSGVGVKPVILAGSDIKLIPNPNNGQFTIKGSLAVTTDEEVSLEVTNVIGQVVYTSKVMVHNGEINERIQLNNLANGMYMLNLRSVSDSKVFHMVIEQ